jgi:hypothetical protein
VQTPPRVFWGTSVDGKNFRQAANSCQFGLFAYKLARNGIFAPVNSPNKQEFGLDML